MPKFLLILIQSVSNFLISEDYVNLQKERDLASMYQIVGPHLNQLAINLYDENFLIVVIISFVLLAALIAAVLLSDDEEEEKKS